MNVNLCHELRCPCPRAVMNNEQLAYELLLDPWAEFLEGRNDCILRNATEEELARLHWLAQEHWLQQKKRTAEQPTESAKRSRSI